MSQKKDSENTKTLTPLFRRCGRLFWANSNRRKHRTFFRWKVLIVRKAIREIQTNAAQSMATWIATMALMNLTVSHHPNEEWHTSLDTTAEQSHSSRAFSIQN